MRGQEPWSEITQGTEEKFKGALEAFSLNLTQIKALTGIDVVHTHTWYVSMAGFLAKKLYDVPFVLTTHSLEPLRAWKAEQLGTGYAMSSWMERTAILDADAVIAVSSGTKDDILRAYPVEPEKIHVIYNGIDLQQYQRTPETSALTEYGVDPAIPYVLFVGRITRQKGVTHLVDAIRYLPPGDPGGSVRRGSRHSGNFCRAATQGGGGTGFQSESDLDRQDAYQAGGHPVLQPRDRLLLPLGL